MISKKMEAAISKQVNAELYAAYLYLDIAAWFEAENLDGFAHWMKAQTFEEMSHAMRLYNHVMDRGGNVEFSAIAKPEGSWKTPVEAFRAAYEHEVKVTKMISDLVKLANEEGDYTALVGVLQWFVNEQIEEEDQTLTATQRLQKLGDDKQALYLLDKEFGTRVLIATATVLNPAAAAAAADPGA
jgi:ferritin